MRGIQLDGNDIEIKVVKDRYGKITSGVSIGDILPQNQAIILSMNKGELKENPSIGVGLSDMLLSEDVSAIRYEIRQQLELDGQTVKEIAIGTTGIMIDAQYIR